jgi:hypothetical protein
LGQGSSIRRRLAGDDAMVDVEDRHEWFGERRSGSGGWSTGRWTAGYRVSR